MSKINKLIEQAKEITEVARIVPFKDIKNLVFTGRGLSLEDLLKVSRELFPGGAKDNDPVTTTDFLKTVERLYGRRSAQYVQTYYLFSNKGWESFNEQF